MKKLFTLFAAALFATGMYAQGMTSLITNGDLSDDADGSLDNYVVKIAPSTDPVPATLDQIDEVDGVKCIKIEVPVQENNPWDSQFWIKFNEPLNSDNQGTKFHVKFQYRAESVISGQCDAQSHITPGNYNTEINDLDLNFTDEWQTIEFDGVIGGWFNNGDFGCIAWNLSKTDGAHVYYFGDFEVTVKKVTKADPEWVNFTPNGDCEAPMEYSVYPEEGIPAFGRLNPNGEEWDHLIYEIQDGVGVDGSRGLVIQARDDAANAWDTQFFIESPHLFAEGERLMVKFDHMVIADADIVISSQTQGRGENGGDGGYIGGFANSFTSTGAWQTYEKAITVSADQETHNNGPASRIVFCLNENQNPIPVWQGGQTELSQGVTYIFDNIGLYLDDGDDGYTTEDEMDYIKELNDAIAEYKAANPTGINSAKIKNAASKAMFNTAGQQVDSNYKGIVIVNGQKRINK